MQLGFASYDGGQFLWFYAGLIVAAIIAGIWIPGFLRPDGRDTPVRDGESLAYLAGGTARFVESVLAALFARGDLLVNGKLLFRPAKGKGQTRAERDIMRHGGDLKWGEAKSQLADHAAEADRDLTHKGLLLKPGDRTKLRWLPVLPFLLVLAIGFYRRAAGVAEGEPVGYLTMLMVFVGIMAVARALVFNPRTRAGNEALLKATRDAERLRSAPTVNETGLAVGLFGTGVLIGTPMAPLHAMRQSGGGDGGGSSGDSGSDGGGGGCGGGGCGGCGG